MQKKIALGWLGSVLVLVSAGCSSAPYSKGYAVLPDSVREIHDYSRSAQKKMNKGTFAGPQGSLENMEKRMAGSDCYRIVSVYQQWGILEPETIYLGESMADNGQKAYIFVPPLLDENKLFPTPKEDKKLKVYRVDQDTPYGPRLIALMQQILGDKNHCVKFGRVPASEQPETSVIVGQVIHKSEYKSTESPAEPAAKAPEAPAASAAVEPKKP